MSTSRLGRRLRADAFTVEELLADVQRGKLRVPTFQRPLRWRRDNVIALFDSIYRGFPIGNLVLAKRDARDERLQFGPVVIDAAARDDAWYLVDGQQRVTALVGALLHPAPIPYGDTHAIWFDLETEDFVHLSSPAPSLTHVPLNVLASTIALLTWANDWTLRSERPDLVERAIAVSRMIREYRLPAYVLDGSDEESIRLIFARLHTTGVAMREHEIFDALHGSDQARPIEAASLRLEGLGLGPVPPPLLMRIARTVTGRGDLRDMPDVDAERLVKQVEDATRRTLAFLRDDVGLPHQAALPCRLPLLTLPRLFQRHPDPPHRVRQLLARWVWRGALTREHVRLGDAEMRRIVDELDDDIGEAASRLSARLGRAWAPLSLDERWNARSTTSRLFALALSLLEPRDLDGEPLPLDPSHWAHPTRLFISPFRKGITPLAERLLMLAHGDLVAERGRAHLRESLLDATPDVLASHGIDDRARACLAAGDADGFVHARARALTPRFEAIFRIRAGVGLTDRPPIGALIERAREALAS